MLRSWFPGSVSMATDRPLFSSPFTFTANRTLFISLAPKFFTFRVNSNGSYRATTSFAG